MVRNPAHQNSLNGVGQPPIGYTHRYGGEVDEVLGGSPRPIMHTHQALVLPQDGKMGIGRGVMISGIIFIIIVIAVIVIVVKVLL